MATKLEKMKWNLYLKKRKRIIVFGLKTGLIHTYEEELIENLRHVYYGGLPASIVLLCKRLCSGWCNLFWCKR